MVKVWSAGRCDGRHVAPLVCGRSGHRARDRSSRGSCGDLVGQSASRSPPGSTAAELAANVVTVLNARADLVAYGAAAEHLAQLRALDARLTGIARSSALAAGVGAGLAVLCAGGAVWGALALGTSAVRNGTMSGVTLAVVVLIPLAAF